MAVQRFQVAESWRIHSGSYDTNDAEAGKNSKYVEGLMVFTHAKQGLMAEASAGEPRFEFQPLSP